MLSVKKLFYKILQVPTFTATVSGATLVRQSMVAGFGNMGVGRIDVRTSTETGSGDNICTGTIKVNGKNANGIGVSFSGNRPIIALILDGTLTARNASTLSIGATTSSIIMIVGGGTA